MRLSCLRWICSIFVLVLFSFSTHIIYAQNVDAADLGSSNEFIYKFNNQRVYSMRVSATLGDATLTQLTSQATTGTYTAADIPSFSLYYNDVEDFSSATLIGTSTSGGNGTTLTFNGLSQVIPGDGAYRYLFIAANVSSTAVTGRTFGFNFFSASNFSWTTAVNVSASLGGSGKKTIQPDDFVTTWNTTNSGIGNDRIFLNILGTGPINYTVSYQDVNNAGIFGSFAPRNTPSTFIFPSPGTYQIIITGTYSQIINGGNLDVPKLLSVDHWGSRAWSSMAGAFSQCSNLHINATDTPNLTVATSLHQMFAGASSVNEDLSNWDVSNITDMSEVFSFATSFNQDISSWDVSNVTNMIGAFTFATSFNQDINNWNVSNVTNMQSMFRGTDVFNQTLSNWDISNVTNFSGMFSRTGSFNQPLNTWDMSSADRLDNMFDEAAVFNGDISNWNVSNVTNMASMFSYTAAFNVDISGWDISNVTYAPGMFNNATAFNQNINGWDVSGLDDLNNMFAGATSFNQPLNSWDVGNVLTMSGTFARATAFNQDLSAWNTGTAEDMSYMFQGANSFNQNISGWDVSKVNNMNYMFSDNLAFDQDLGSWHIDVVSSMDHMFDYSALSVANYDNALTGWASLSAIPNNVTLGAAGKKYCAAEDERNDLINIHGWIITDAGKLCTSNPVITLFNPVSGLPGTTVTIVGLNFNTNASDNAVYFGAVRANVVSATSTQLVVEVPAGATSVAPIVVQDLINGLQANSLVTVSGNHARQFTVTYAIPKALKYKLKTQPINLGAQVNAVAVADFNNDGNPDFATANTAGGSVSIALGSGSGGFSMMPSVTIASDPWSITTGDFNNDGNLDFLTASPVDGCMMYLALGNGNGTFGTPTAISGGGCTITAVAADFNNDGNLDVVAGNNSSNPSRILLGDGTGNLAITVTPIPSITQAHSIAVGDYNGDGIADLAIEDLTNMYIRLGAGDGTFTVGATLTPGDTPYSITTGDFNNDGILDLAEVNNISNDVYAFLGDGSGGFSFSSFIMLPSGAEARSVTVGDFNGDGNVDLAVANTSIGRMSIALGDGSGSFSTPVTFNLDATSIFPTAVASADFDKDGKADLVTGNSADASIFLMFTPPLITSLSPTHGYPGATITINGDNFNPGAANDIYFGAVKVTANANATGTSITLSVPAGATSVTPIVVRNNANNLQASSLASTTPYFTSSLPASNLSPASYIKTSYPTPNPISVAAADFDNDGYVDLAVPDTGFKNITLLKNDGSGSFTFPWSQLTPSVNIFNLKAADINGDGNADLIGASTSNSELTLFLGNGNGSFTHLSDINGVTGNGSGLSIADVDNDGTPELITSYGGDHLAVLKGDGSGNFATATGSPYTIAGANVPGALITADFNNDTYVDIAVTNSNASNIYILLNNQDGTFATPVSVPTGASAFQIVAGRFDSDSNIDLAVLAYGSSNMTILRGDGSGGFSPFAGSPVAIGGTPLGLYGGDFDGDGITDLIVGGNDQNNIGFFKGNGSGGFAQFPSFPYPISGVQPYGVITADFNNDGRADVATAGSNEVNVLLYHSQAFITRWSTTDNKIVIPHGNGSFNYDITWRNLTNTGIGDGTTTVVDGPNTTFTISGLNNTDIYEVEITGAFPHFKSMDIFSPTSEPLKLRSIENWGNIVWESMNSAFAGCTNLVYNATDKPNLTNVTDMSYMFYDCHAFNGNIDSWDVSSVTNMSYLFFQNQVFNHDLNNWDVSNVTDMSGMFQHNFVFNGNISNWDVGSVTNANAMFDGCALFNRDVSGWDVSSLVNMQSMFSVCQEFNQNLNSWNVSNVTNMSFAFATTPAFNSPLNNWDVSNVTNMRNLFDGSGFNNPIGNWDVSNVTNMAGMLAQGPFNQNISSWDVSNVTDMSSMFFNNTAFNRPLASWNVGNVTNTGSMFRGASSFNQNLAAWDVTSVTSMSNMFDGSGLSDANYDNVLIGWAAQSVQNNVTLGALGKRYCAGESARAALIASHSWIIIDAGPCAPTIASFTPTSGISGTTVVITGTKFTGATAVTFGGTNAASFIVDSPTQITAVVGAGSSGNVAVTTSAGTGSLAGFVFIGAPSITSFTPASAGAGGTVTINGNNFDGTTSVTFGGTAASSFTVVSATTITATVGSGTSGDVEVTNPAGSDTQSGFTFVPAPTITSFTPTTAAGGSTVTITGTNFDGATAVTFGGTNASSFTVISSTSIEAVVANGSTGTIAVTTVGGTATSSGTFTFIPAPTITSFTPTTAATGETVTITGTDFTGTTSVTFGGTAATSFTVVSATEITAIVASGTSGDVEVTTSGGTAALSGFTFIPASVAPTISSFTPTSASVGATVTITGTDFTGATSVSFGGVAATSFIVVSSTTITAVVSTGATGDVSVTTPGGTATLAGFTFVNATAPVVVVKDGDNNSGSPVPSQPNQAVDLGQTFVGKAITKAFTIENTGTADLQITSITIDNTNFEITEKPTVIAPGGFGRLAVRLKAEQIGIYSARIAIQYQSGSFEFNVTGEVKDPAITVYNAVTPNGDGNHDYLKIVNIELYPGNTVTIINRLGEPVFKISDYDNNNPAKRFVGEANTGSSGVLTDGTYYYIIDIGTKDNHTGFLLLQK